MTVAADFGDVLIAVVVSLPAILSAVTALRVHKAIQTPSGTNIGKQVEDNRHVGLANHYLLRSAGAASGVAEPQASKREVEQVDELERADD